MRYDLVAGDLEPAIQASLSNPSGDPLPAGSVAQFVMLQAEGTKRVAATAVIDDPTIPTVHYQWQQGDTDTPGVYRAQWRVAIGSSGGPLETWPSDEEFYVVIHPKL